MEKTILGIPGRLLRSAKRWLIPFPESKWIFPVWFWGLLVLLALIKLWLVSTQTIVAMFRPHDDLLFLRLAQHIASGEWLGAYNSLTLAKLPFYPLWIASMFWLGIPLSYSQQLLYVCGCFVFVIAVRPLLRNNPLLLLIFYTTLLFHPISYPIREMERVLRGDVYFSLSLLVFSFAIGLLLRKDAPIKNFVLWNIGLGFSFAAFWLTREEGVILLPSLILLLVTLFVPVGLFSKGKKKRLGVCCVPIIIAAIAVGSVAGINKIYYGVFTTCEQTQSDFANAYGALTRVVPKPFQMWLPVSRETRKRIYTVSPAFAELRPFLEGKCGKVWGHFGPYQGKDISSFFIWAFREAVALAGYYSSGESAAKYYRRLTMEVNNACDQGKLECYKMRQDGLAFLRHEEYLGPFISTFSKTIFSVVWLENFHIEFCPLSEASDQTLLFYKDMTKDRIAPRKGDSSLLNHPQSLDVFKLYILDALLLIFRFYLFSLVVLGVISYVYHMVLVLKKGKFGIPFVIMTALLLAALARLFVLSMIGVTYRSKFAFSLQHQSPLYPLLAAFSLIAIAMFFIKGNDEYSIPFGLFKLRK